MDRLANFDVTRFGKSAGAKVAAQVGFGVFCACSMIAVRSIVDIVAPTAGPFALIYPPILVATLYGRLLAGLITQILSLLWVWWYILPSSMPCDLEIATDASRIGLNVVSTGLMILLAEAFRRATCNASAARDREIERRIMLMKELEHRSKNNFTLVASLLALQQRRTPHPEVREALELAIGRVDTFAKAYENLAMSETADVTIPMQRYIGDVVSRVSAGAFGENVVINTSAHELELPQRRAVAIGLFINEALTNCAKYAFPDGRAGRVDVVFKIAGEGWTLTVSDDGVGTHSVNESRGGGMGQGLMGAFAAQAEAEYEVFEAGPGRTVAMSSKAC